MRNYQYKGVKKSIGIYERAGEVIPGYTQLRSRLASGFAEGVSPIYADHAKGSRFVDVDGNEFIDWVNAVSAIILGHHDDIVDDAVKEQIDRGSIYTVNSPKEVELAEELIDTIPSAEMVKYGKGGGDACAIAARIARGATGKDIILFSGYHGWHDWYQSANYLDFPDLVTGVGGMGVPKVLAGTAIPFGEFDIDKLQDLFDEHKGKVAAVMMEPVRSTDPPEGYLESVKALCHKNNAILIFDEVSCGWRIAIGGAQEYYGITPDMTVVAKCISNGYPMGAVVGKREFMKSAEDMFISSSYWSDNVGLTASITTIRELKRRNSPESFKEKGENIRAAIKEAINDVGISADVTGLFNNPGLHIDLPDESLRPKVNTLFIQEMAKRGIHTTGRFMATLAHTDEDIRATAEAARESLKVVRNGLEGNLDDLLEAHEQRESIQRIVR
ncbi:MAG: aminotransferase class III-fold pyridoxal phosphate-dependent enzyme [SAR202 cluster bacterium]|nr:aminotransferase class III-fold pyridoxal phosphate-dependent enzyme [SAR202 cluster bacterium]